MTKSVVKLTENLTEKTYVYSGNEWILHNINHNIDNIDQINELTLVSGDIVNIFETLNNNTKYLKTNDNIVTTFKGGHAGKIVINTNSILLSQNAKITTSSKGDGNAGNVSINNNSLKLDNNSEISSDSKSFIFGGYAGSIAIGKEIILEDDMLVSIKPCSSISLSNNSFITTDSQSSGGGKIKINTLNTLYALNSNITTNVKDGKGNGGDIKINSGNLILNNSYITANAIDGDGGAIFIETDNYLKSYYSNVEASSKRGNEGTVKILAPDIDISNELVMLQTNFLNAGKWVKKSCLHRNSESVSSLTIDGRDAIQLYDDFCPSPPD